MLADCTNTTIIESLLGIFSKLQAKLCIGFQSDMLCVEL